ncbi:Clp protease ClpP [Roseomonas gilardii]|uniref:ATP-dependent Clp protease proteolytic subunit n=1 Tax=Roseomonas gilardii TaxID=257708 RepID=A0ABU3MBH4_9PROT|nr:head maturation protease, ClpP-related [Roseomonas gilardii]MDT8330197.1 Clp protease ClpP [Roseomonas gilardii]
MQDLDPAALSAADEVVRGLTLAAETGRLQARGPSSGPAEMELFGVVGLDFTARDVTAALRAVDGRDVNIRLNSPGGLVTEGFAAFNALARHKGHKTVTVEGQASSIAAFMAMAADEIVMPQASLLMIHASSGGAIGNSETLERVLDVLRKIDGIQADVFASRSGMDRAKVVGMLTAETYFTGAEAVAAGLADRQEDRSVEAGATALADTEIQRIAALGALSPVAMRVTNPEAVREAFRTPEANSPTTPATPAPQQEAQMADPNPAPVTPAPTPVAQPAAKATLDQIKAIAARAKLGADWTLAQLEAGVTEMQALDAALAVRAADVPDRPAGHVVVTRDQRDTFRARAAGALAARFSGTGPNEEQREFYAMGLQGMLRECLAQAGVAGVHRLSPEQVLDRVRAEHTTSDFPVILRDASNRRLAQKYDTYPQTWKEWTREVDVADFREINVGDLGGFPKLRAKPEASSVRYGALSEAGEKYRLLTGASGVVLSREAIINDDLNAFGRMLDDAADVSYAWVADQAYGVLTLNPNMGDGNALFSTPHGNIVTAAMLPTGGTLGLDEDNMAAIEQLLLNQKNLGGDVLAPPTGLNVIVGTAAQFNQAVKLGSINTTMVAGQQLALPAYANRLKPILEPRVAALGGPFFVTAQNRPTVEIAYLQGRRRPELTSMEDFDTKGMKYALVFDAAAAPISWRGMVRHPGKAS